jgi:hypothetical protein
MKGHRTFEQDKIRKLLVKTTQIKTKGVRNNSSKEAIKEATQQYKDEDIVKVKSSRVVKIVL